MSDKPYRAKITLYNNRLREALEEEFPDAKSVKEMAYRMGVGLHALYALLTMRDFPLHKRHGIWTNLAMKLSTELNKSPEWLFDPELYGKGRLTATKVLDADRLLENSSPEHLLLDKERAQLLPVEVNKAVAGLGMTRPEVIRKRFGLEGEKEKSLQDVGKDIDVTRERVRQIEAKALRKLRHPKNSHKLREFVS